MEALPHLPDISKKKKKKKDFIENKLSVNNDPNVLSTAF